MKPNFAGMISVLVLSLTMPAAAKDFNPDSLSETDAQFLSSLPPERQDLYKSAVAEIDSITIEETEQPLKDRSSYKDAVLKAMAAEGNQPSIFTKDNIVSTYRSFSHLSNPPFLTADPEYNYSEMKFLPRYLERYAVEVSHHAYKGRRALKEAFINVWEKGLYSPKQSIGSLENQMGQELQFDKTHLGWKPEQVIGLMYDDRKSMLFPEASVQAPTTQTAAVLKQLDRINLKTPYGLLNFKAPDGAPIDFLTYVKSHPGILDRERLERLSHQ